MPSVPRLWCRDIVRAFENLGWTIRKNSTHVIMIKEGHRATLSIPNHHEVARGTLRSLIRDADVTVEEFLRAAEH